MFPAAEFMNQNNTDFSFLDGVCLPEDNQLAEIQDMSDMNFVQGNPFPVSNTLSIDWLSGNIGLDTLISEQTSIQTVEVNTFSPCCSDASYSTLSGPAETIPIDVYEDCFPLSENEHLVAEKADSVEVDQRIFSSNEIPKEQVYLQNDESLTSIDDVVSIEKKDDDYGLAGKKYLKMRQKNNIASQRSRKLRKQKNVDMVERLKNLEVENKELSVLVTKMEKERDSLQKLLLQIISKK